MIVVRSAQSRPWKTLLSEFTSIKRAKSNQIKFSQWNESFRGKGADIFGVCTRGLARQERTRLPKSMSEYGPNKKQREPCDYQ